MSAAEDFAEPWPDNEDLIGEVPLGAGPVDPWAARRATEAEGSKHASRLLELPKDVLQNVIYQIAVNDPSAFARGRHGPSKHELDIEEEVAKRRVRAEAQAVIAAEDAAERLGNLPAPVNLADLLAEPDEDTKYLVDDLWPVDGKIVLAAKNKAGKTTLVGNLIRSLVDGQPFLDHFEVQQAARVVLIDDELSPGMIRRWLREQEITNTAAVSVLSLRGRASSFNILDPTIRSEWAGIIGAADVLLFDCLRPALDALGLSEDKDSGRFLESLDELVAEAGCANLGVVHHMGHGNERSRGDSRIEDWPDAKWRLVKEHPDDEASPRFFGAYGRDVDQPEMQLAYSDFGRRLSIQPGGGSRAKAKASRLTEAILTYVGDHPGASKTSVENAIRGDDKEKRRAIQELRDDGLIVVHSGANRSQLHFLPEAAPTSD